MLKTCKILFFMSFVVGSIGLHAQGTQQTFGKNRVQFHKNFDEWTQYESENCVTFWYGESRPIGQVTAMSAELDFAEIQQLLDYRLTSKVELIVYSDITDLHQSNIGSTETFNTANNGVKVVGTKVFLHFDGNHDHLRRQMREGVAGVFLNSMLFGANWQEIVQNAVLLNLPQWFKQGLVSYVAEDWNPQLDNQLRDVFLQKKYKNFDKFVAAEPRLAGHAFWYFIAQQYGRANVSNLLYLTRINRSVEDGFVYVLGNSYKQTLENFNTFYQKRYENEVQTMEAVEKMTFLKIKNKRKLPVTTIKMSPDGKKIAYVLNELGRYKIYLHDLQSGEQQLILKGGTRNAFQATDKNYPLVAWNPDNQRLGIILEKRDVVYFVDYDLAKKTKKREPMVTDLQRVYNFEFINPREILLSAASRGTSDIFTYNTVNRNFKKITNDPWDDLDATMVNINGKRGLLFASNRLLPVMENEKLDTVLPINHFDIFYKDLDDTSRALVRVTHTPDADERYPNLLDSTNFTFLSSENGIFNRKTAYLTQVLDYSDRVYFYKKLNGSTNSLVVRADSASVKLDSTLKSLQPMRDEQRDYYKTIAIASNISNYNRNIVAQHTASRAEKTAELIDFDGKKQIRILNLNKNEVKSATPSAYFQYFQKQKLKMLSPAPLNLGNRLMELPNRNNPKNNPNKTDKIVEKSENTTPIKTDSTPKLRSKYLFQSEFQEISTETAPPQYPNQNADEIGQESREISNDSLPNAPKVIKNGENGEPNADNPTPQPNRYANFPEARFGKIRYGRNVPYSLKFKIDDIVSTVDNSLLFGGLDSYAGSPQTNTGFSRPPVGYLVKGVFKDLLEDYQLEMGARLPLTFDGAEYFVVFDNKKHQLDQRYAVYHRSRRFSDNQSIRVDNDRQRMQTTLGYYEIRYPLDVFTRFQAGATFRNDRFTKLATDTRSLNAPSLNEQRLGLKLEYVFDNALDLSPNLRVGTRAKVYAEIMQKMNIQFQDTFRFNLANGTMTVLGFDVRQYIRLGKHAIFAARVAGATSLGSERILHYLGGVDQEFFGQYESSVSVPTGNYAFQTLAANMRGFGQNIRNGSTYALINSELRLPFFRYFSQKPLKRAFWRDFQVVGFFDIGTAWHGKTPFAKDNPLNTLTVSNPTSVVTVSYFKDPLVAGYGVGLHFPLSVVGFARIDYAWGIETRVVQRPRWHFSIGYDF
ncbi:MAG: hypothetical protein RL757_3236 [Bacteroidota bacterium]|jgi:hypothetical protein